MNDICQRFLFEKKDIRGEVVQLTSSYQTIMEQHQYPGVIRQLLGEALVAVTLLAETIKFDGQITLQYQSDGPVKTLVAKCTHDGHIRGLAQWDKDILPIDVKAALGQGQLVVTIEYAKQAQPYQSIIPIQQQTVAQALEAYFMQSEQLPTRLYIDVSADAAAGLLIQAMPASLRDADQSLWTEIVMLADTITGEELRTLGPQTIVHRLFNEHDVRLFDAKPIAFRCTCSPERMGNAIRTLGKEDALAMLTTQKEIVVTCEFCSQSFVFDRAAVDALF